MIKINKLNKYYNKGKAGELHVIDNTTLEFKTTGLVCILGESGSGKTTLLNTLGGLDTFQGGHITIDHQEFDRYSGKEIEKLRNAKFGYIFQDQFLLQDNTVEYNIRLALNSYEISEEEKAARIDYVLQAVDMKKYKKRLISQLSGGQKQRIAIARALVKSPEVIFADEPTGNLDEANTLRIMSIIKKISKECLIILVTHERRIAEFFADRILSISNGRIVKDIYTEAKHAYCYNDDTSLYLKEYEKETYSSHNVSINLYNSGGENEIKLNMVFLNGKLYIQSTTEAEVVYLTSQDEQQLIDEARPELEISQIEEFDYTLKPICKNKDPKLSFKETLKLASENRKRIGRKQIFLILTFIITSILMVIAATDYMTAITIDKKSIVAEDSHYVSVVGKRNSSAKTEQYYNSFNDIYSSFLKNALAKDIYIDLDAKLSFTYAGFRQTKQLDYSISEFSYVTLEHFKKETLICGRLPENRFEIIIDKWLIDVFENSDSVFTSLMPDMQSFLGLIVKSDITAQNLTIVGICDTNEPTVYIDKYTGISTASWAEKVASIAQLQKEYPKQYDKTMLAKDEVLVSDAVYKKAVLEGKNTYLVKSGEEFKIAGTFPEEFGAAYVIEDKYYNSFLSMYIKSSRRFLIYSDEKEKLLNYFNENVAGFDTTFVKLIATDNYSEYLAKYKAARAVTINTRLIVTAAIFTLSMLMLYFTMKSNAMRRVQELTVYRLLGITKGSILAAFVLEIIEITSCTVLPVVLISSSIVKAIAATPSLQSDIVYPWYAAGLLLLFIYTVNILVGILPVYHIIKLPPAQIAKRV